MINYYLRDMAKHKIDLNSDFMRILLLVVGSIFSTAVLAFSVLAIVDIHQGNFTNAPAFLFGVFICMIFTRLITFIKDRSKINLIRCLVLLVFNIAIAVTVLFANSNPYLFSLCGGLYCFTIIISRVFRMIQKHNIRNIILNVLIIALALLMAIGLLIQTSSATVNDVIIVECLFIAIVSFIEVATAALSQLKLKVLFKIIVRTYTLEVIFGLLTLIVASSLVFMVYEPNITTFGDALWYSFAVVTTIGFGDLAAETLIGRILTVVLGVYGLIVVAILTSIIVNFYNETAGKESSQTFREIKKEEDKDKK